MRRGARKRRGRRLSAAKFDANNVLEDFEGPGDTNLSIFDQNLNLPRKSA